MMTSEEREEWLRVITPELARELVPHLRRMLAPPPDPIPYRLTVAQVALVVQRSEDRVRRHINSNRAGIRRWVSGPPYLIDPAALPVCYRVPLELVRRRLEAAAAPRLAA
jgi:hypothetical protein